MFPASEAKNMKARFQHKWRKEVFTVFSHAAALAAGNLIDYPVSLDVGEGGITTRFKRRNMPMPTVSKIAFSRSDGSESS
jgi:hypothetical protein